MKDEKIRARFGLFDYPQRIDKSWYFQFERIERFWSALGEVKVIDYDMSMREYGSIIPDILHEIGLSRDLSSNIFLNKSMQ